MRTNEDRLKVVGIVDEEDSETVMEVWKISLVGRKFRIIGKMTRLKETGEYNE